MGAIFQQEDAVFFAQSGNFCHVNLGKSEIMNEKDRLDIGELDLFPKVRHVDGQIVVQFVKHIPRSGMANGVKNAGSFADRFANVPWHQNHGKFIRHDTFEQILESSPGRIEKQLPFATIRFIDRFFCNHLSKTRVVSQQLQHALRNGNGIGNRKGVVSGQG